VNSSKIGLAIVAPAGCALDEATFMRGLARLETHGFRVFNYYDHAARHQRFGGTDEARLAQLDAAIDNPDVQVIMALRGSYGVSRILPRIPFERLAASGKILVGFSDITAIHLGLLALTGAKSYAGPMVYGDFGAEQEVDFTLGDFRACLRGPAHCVNGAAASNPVIEVEGTVWGGNLAMVNHLIGTPYMPKVDGGIFFIEDINEHPYRVERNLLQMFYSGALDGQKAILIGEISNYKLAPFDNGYDFEAMLAFLRQTLPMPVLTGLPFGHGNVRATIPVGAHGKLSCQGSDFTLTLTDYPCLT
jgi:muramoyltetrapeptide carboxypeptidase